MAQRVELLSMSVFVRDHCSHVGICTGIPSNTALFLSTGNKYTSLLQHLISCDSSPLLLFRFSRLSSTFRYRSFWSILLFTIFSTFDIWASISVYESPSLTVPIQFWVAQTHVSSIFTDFPRCHRRESLTFTVKLHPILYRIPEHYRREEWQRINQQNPTLYHEPNHSKSSHRSWRRSVFPRGWPSSWIKKFWMILFRTQAFPTSNISKFGIFQWLIARI